MELGGGRSGQEIASDAAEYVIAFEELGEGEERSGIRRVVGISNAIHSLGDPFESSHGCLRSDNCTCYRGAVGAGQWGMPFRLSKSRVCETPSTYTDATATYARPSKTNVDQYPESTLL